MEYAHYIWAGMTGLLTGMLYVRCTHAYLCHLNKPESTHWSFLKVFIIGAALVWAVGTAHLYSVSPTWAGMLLIGGILIVASAIDAAALVLPDMLTLPGFFIAMCVSIGIGMPFADVLLGSFIGAISLWSFQYAYWRRHGVVGVGTGDIKLMLMVGAISGLHGLPTLSLLTAGAGMVTLGWIRLVYQSPVHYIPLGPILAIGCMFHVLLD